MRHTVFGIGGFQPDRPGQNVVEDWDDGIQPPVDELVELRRQVADLRAELERVRPPTRP